MNTEYQNTPESVLPYILHRSPMLLIDELLSIDETRAISQLEIRPELMFCETQGLPTWVSIEIMAQTISLYAGKQGSLAGQPPKLGFLLGTRKLLLPFSHFPFGSRLQITAEKQYIHDNLGVFNCQIDVIQSSSQQDLPPIQAVLSVYEPQDVTEFLNK